MADPILVEIPKDVWTKVATGVTNGMIHKKASINSVYLQTYRETGGTAPTLIDEGVELFKGNELSEEINMSVPIDVYIRCVGADGKVRVDL